MPDSTYLTVQETAKRLGVHENTVRNWVTHGILKSARVPGTRFHRFEAAEVERVAKARGKPVAELLQKSRRAPELAEPEQVIATTAKPVRRRNATTELADAADLTIWAGRRETQGLFPKLVRRLLVATPEVTDLSIIRTEEGTSFSGWDARVSARRGSLWVPPGPSAWELGTDKEIRRKAQADYEKRTSDPLGVDTTKTTFVFATPRRWSGAEAWETERRADKIWRDVRVFDGERLEAWLEATPSVHYWLSEELGLQPRHALNAERWWEEFASRTNPRLPTSLILAGREQQAQDLERFLGAPAQATGLQAGSRLEAIAFVAAAQLAKPEEERREVIVVRSEDVWARLSEASTPMVLVPEFDNPTVAAALEAGHHVISPLGREDIHRGPTIELPRIHRLAAQEALQDAKLQFDESDQLAGLARRSLTSFMRRLAVDPRMAKPRWANGEAASLLASLMLVSSWSDEPEDRDAVTHVTGHEWSAIEAIVRRWSTTEDPPFTQSGGTWHLTSPEEAFEVLHPFLTVDVLERWQNSSVAILAEPDLDLDLSAEEKMLRERPSRHSEVLRRGLTKSLALLGTYGEGRGPGSGGTFADRAHGAVRDLLSRANADETGLVWRTLSDELPLLAEAAPRVFLDAIDRGLSKNQPLLATMFQDTQDQSFFFASSPHTGLLWALETLAWSRDFLPEVVLLLGRLATIDPGGKLANRPTASLRAILLPWIPYTSASADERVDAFRQLRKRYPEIAWKLLLDLLPKFHDHSSPTSSPRFRDWKPDREGVTIAEWATSVEELVRELLAMASEDPARWIDVPDCIAGLPVALRHEVITALSSTIDGLDDDRGRALWENIRREVEHHREFPDAQWAMDRQSLDDLEKIASALAPVDLVTRSARYFDWKPYLPSGTSRIDHEAYARELADYQATLAESIYEQLGFQGLCRLAEESPRPHFVGDAIARSVKELEADQLLPLIGDDGHLGAMAQAWLRTLARLEGVGWPQTLKDELTRLAPKAQARFLVQLNPGDDVDALFAAVGDEAKHCYWRIVNPLVFDGGAIAPAAEELVAHDRAFDAVDLLSIRVRDDGDPPAGVTKELIVSVLRAVLETDPEKIRPDAGFAYSVGRLVDLLERLGATQQELAQIEWAFFAVLEHSSHPPRALYAALKDDPAFFVDLVSLVYRGKSEPRRELDPAAAAAANNAWSVLNAWRDIPGHTGGGQVDADHLQSWVRQARLLLDERDRGDIGDEQIGQVLSGSPPGEDGAWPAEPVRQLIEDIGSRELEAGLHIGKANSRGPSSRGVLDGGDQERAIAEGFRAQAKVTGVTWPRTTRLLIGLAESYEREAQRWDAEAEARSNLD